MSYLYFFIILIIPLNNSFYNKDFCWCHVKKKKNLEYIFLLYYWCHLNRLSWLVWFVITSKQQTFLFLILIKIKISLKKHRL